MRFHWQIQAKAEPILFESITIDKWFVQHFNQAIRLKAKPHLYQSFSIDSKLLTQAENITLDKWIREPILPRWDRKRLQRLYPYIFHYLEEEPPEEPNLPEWFLNANLPRFDVKRWQFVYPFLFWHVDTPPLPLDSWWRQASERIRTKPPIFNRLGGMFHDPSPYFVRARGFIRGLNKDTNTGMGTRSRPIVGRNNDTNTPVGIRNS